MNQYHKIKNVFARDPDTHKLIPGEYTTPELAFLADCQWEFTEKVNGMNIRVMFQPLGSEGCTEPDLDKVLKFAGKTDRAQLPGPLVARLQERFLPAADQLVEMFPGGGCLYGEGYGPKIQKGGGL